MQRGPTASCTPPLIHPATRSPQLIRRSTHSPPLMSLASPLVSPPLPHHCPCHPATPRRLGLPRAPSQNAMWHHPRHQCCWRRAILRYIAHEMQRALRETEFCFDCVLQRILWIGKQTLVQACKLSFCANFRLDLPDCKRLANSKYFVRLRYLGTETEEK